MKFEHSNIFNEQFEEIPEIRFYPYVGKKFDKQKTRIMVFAHNIYCAPDKYESEQIRTKSKTHFADALEEYTYHLGKWTKAWRKFIKGSCSVNVNYTSVSDDSIVSKIDDFVEKICYINDLVKSNSVTNVYVSPELKLRSNNINKNLLEILNITHCVCWGKDVFNYLKNLSEYETIVSQKLSKKGFEYSKIKNLNTNKIIHVLRVFHPSMPGFGEYEKETQIILSEFYSK